MKILVLWNFKLSSLSLGRRMDSFPGFQTLWSGNITGHVTDLFIVDCTSSAHKLRFEVLQFSRNNDSPREFGCFLATTSLVARGSKSSCAVRLQPTEEDMGIRDQMRNIVLAGERWGYLPTLYLRRKLWVIHFSWTSCFMSCPYIYFTCAIILAFDFMTGEELESVLWKTTEMWRYSNNLYSPTPLLR